MGIYGNIWVFRHSVNMLILC